MSEAVIAAKRPAALDLDAGTYWWCRCGRSEHQPFCDGSHRDTGLSPLKLELEEPQRLLLCQCKQTGNAPLCDGSHRDL